MINARDIAKIENKRREIKKETFTKIYEQFSRKIRHHVELGQKQVFLNVPAFVMGFPVFNQEEATKYLKRQLERADFDVTSTGNFEFLVTWGTAKPSREAEPDLEPQGDLPSLMNLRKAANKYRRT
jgi:hypothetical protein